MHSQIVGYFPLLITVSFHCLRDLFIPFANILEDVLWKNFLKAWPVYISLTLLEFSNIFLSPEVIYESICKLLLPKNALNPGCFPYRLLLYAVFYKLSVCLLGNSPRRAELIQNPLRG